MENEVVFESETNSVTFAANSCFAEFGTSPQEAPELFFGAKENLTDREKSLAVCLATPFEGKPELLSRIKPRLLVAFSRDQSELCASELERKHLKRLLSYEQRKKRLGESTFNRLCRKNASLIQSIMALFWQNALQSVYNRSSSLPISLLEKLTPFVWLGGMSIVFTKWISWCRFSWKEFTFSIILSFDLCHKFLWSDCWFDLLVRRYYYYEALVMFRFLKKCLTNILKGIWGPVNSVCFHYSSHLHFPYYSESERWWMLTTNEILRKDFESFTLINIPFVQFKQSIAKVWED